MNNKNKRKTVIGVIAATGIAAGVACNAHEHTSSAQRIIIDGQEMSADTLTREIGRNMDVLIPDYDSRRITTKYGGPPSFDRYDLVLSPEEIEFGIREIIAEQFEIDIDSVTAEMPIDLKSEGIETQWNIVLSNVAHKYRLSYNYFFDNLIKLEAPVVGDLMEIVKKDYKKYHNMELP